LNIKTIGSRKNRDALGAQVKVTAEELVQVKEVYSGGSYISQNDTRLHFGLGNKTRVDSIEVRWPAGKVEVIRDVPANGFVVIEEGKGVARRVETAKPQTKKQ
jgi:enediyne biosynthesis protein E4